MHSLALAYFASAKTSFGEPAFFVHENSAPYVSNKVDRKMCMNQPLVVSVELFQLLEDEFKVPEVDMGMQYGGGLEPGTQLFSGVNIPMRASPSLATDAVTIDNSYYEVGKRQRIGSNSVVDLV